MQAPQEDASPGFVRHNSSRSSMRSQPGRMLATPRTPEHGETSEFSPPPHRARIFALIVIGTFCGQLGLSIITPFFPKEAAVKDVSQAVLGWIFSIFELATMIGTTLAMQCLVRFGSKPLLFAANALGGFGNILLGFCWYVGAGVPFIVSCMFLRITAGFAFALMSTTGYGLLPALYGKEVSNATGMMEGVNGVAMIIGPIVGSLLFNLGGGEDSLGFVVPFVVLGGIEFVFSFGNLAFLPSLPTPPGTQPSMRNFSWQVFLPFINCVVTGIGLGLLGPTLEPHLSEPPLNYSIPTVGLVTAAACGAYALVAPLAGAFDDWLKGRLAIAQMAFGDLVTGIGYGLLGPVPAMQISAASVWTGAVLVGFGVGIGLIPVNKQILLRATHADNEEAEVATAALFTISLSMGSFLGPTLGGMLSAAVGVRNAYTYTAVSLWALGILLGVLFFLPAFSPSRTRCASAARALPLLSEGTSSMQPPSAPITPI